MQHETREHGNSDTNIDLDQVEINLGVCNDTYRLTKSVRWLISSVIKPFRPWLPRSLSKQMNEHAN
jgi:hypothetical protein